MSSIPSSTATVSPSKEARSAGENDTYSGEGVLAGIYKKLSFSVGGFHYQTRGFRKNADQDDDIGNAFVQLETLATNQHSS